MPDLDRDATIDDRQGRWATFAQVPAAGPDARPDPHYQQLRGRALLPASYMPPPMHGFHRPWARLIAAALIGVFFVGALAGVCLTGW